jgi:acetate---CoA ligase (ADP-forming)
MNPIGIPIAPGKPSARPFNSSEMPGVHMPNGRAALQAVDPIYDIVLRDGSTLALRRAVQGDTPVITRFFEGLSRQSLYQRFLGFPSLEARTLSYLVPHDASEGTALVGESAGRIVAFAGFYPSDASGDRAEVAFAIADALQGRGIGTRLLERLVEIARERGISV